MSLYNDKYRIPSIRLNEWDYASAAVYFVTICTAGKQSFFGYIDDNGEMHHSELGEMVCREWDDTFNKRPDMNLDKDVFVVMPNHFHAIIIIGQNKYNEVEGSTNSFGKQSKNLASIIRGFKATVTSKGIKVNGLFAWQTRFYEHVIRNREEYEKIASYIRTNSSRWVDDCYHSIL